MPATYAHPGAIASTEWLAAHLDDPDLRIFETTTLLIHPPEGHNAAWLVQPGRDDYDQGHIPGAGFLDVEGELSDHSGPSHVLFTMPEPAVLAATLAERGIGAGTRVVLYSRGTASWATRVWWMLRAIGFDDAAVLDGGWEKWQSEGRPVDTSVRVYPPAALIAHPRGGVFVGKDAVQDAIGDAAVCTISALNPDSYRGENPRYGRVGRIPGSVNVPNGALVDPVDNSFVAPDTAAAAAAFRAVGAEGRDRNIVYCGGGIAASLDAFLMHQLGYENVAIYDASMSEWARDESLPIETD